MMLSGAEIVTLGTAFMALVGVGINAYVAVVLKDIHRQTNSMSDALVKGALLQGKSEGVEAEKQRAATRAAAVAEGVASVVPALLTPVAAPKPVEVSIVPAVDPLPVVVQPKETK